MGTRLHGGILALKHRRRSLIIGVDHRANEIGKDIDLPVIDRYADREAIERMILEPREVRIKLPVEKIRTWREQFASKLATGA